MNIDSILTELKGQRARIDAAIAALQGIASDNRPLSTARQLANGRRRKRMSLAARKKISQMMKQRWAERKKKAKAA